MRKIQHILLAGAFTFFCQASFSQLGFTFDIKKPKPYEERVLRSEKSDEKKFSASRRFFQNTFTHYNYFYNANNKLNEVLERAKMSHQDDYSQLLTFYNYTLEAVSQSKVELDSLINKSKTAIVLHDLRNDWVDNMYLIWGISYYLRQNFDSARLMFQFINYAFAPKEKDGYYRFIGSKADGNIPTSISTKENNTLLKRVFSEPPSRNDAFIWQIRTHIAAQEYSEASSLISQLKNDPVFPERLKNDLEEVQALYFYQLNMWDSCALHLSYALDNATNKNEKARWEYLIGQLYEKSNKLADAQVFYTKVINHTLNPVLEIYARLSSIRVNKEGGDNYIEKNIADLVKMGRKDRYIDYRDIIFLTAGQLEMERNNKDAADFFFRKSLSYNYGNSKIRNKAFLQLAEILFSKKQYRQAANFYDSLQWADASLPEPLKLQERRGILAKLASQAEIIERQDSLQQLASMEENERKSIVKKLVRKLRKAQGLKDEDFKGAQGLSSAADNAKSADLFSTSGKGEWYFYNQTTRTKGQTDFKNSWGNRPNVDNWRRSAAITSALNQQNQNKTGNNQNGNNSNQPAEITFDALYNKIPLTPEKMKLSDDSIQHAMFELTNIYAEKLEDCASCIEISEALRSRFPDFSKMDQVLFHLYYCYQKNGEIDKAQSLKNLMLQKYAGSHFTEIVKTGKNKNLQKEASVATKLYENIYDLFIEGNFEKAINKKKSADSIYGSNYWKPQLLYIEAIYYVKQGKDDLAKNTLTNIMSMYSSSPLARKAQTLFEVLNRRSIIENELANLVIERPTEEPSVVKKEEPPVTTQPEPITEEKAPVLTKDANAVTKNETQRKPDIAPKKAITKSATDTLTVKVPPPPLPSYNFNPNEKHFVMIILNKVDNVFRNEAKNAFSIYNREKYYNKPFEYTTIDLDADNKLLLIGGFENADAAVDYISQAKPIATTRIIPWLKPEKYSFSLISETNLETLKTKPLLEDYKNFTDKYWPGKF